MQTELPELTYRPLYKIAREIRKEWGAKVSYAAAPYLDAMGTLEGIDQNYFLDSGREIVLRFLSNASSFRGDKAKALKKELKSICGVK